MYVDGSSGNFRYHIRDNYYLADRFTIDGGYEGFVGIGTTTPTFPLSLGEGIGNKLALYDGAGDKYGFGIQPNLLQIFAGGSYADIVFGNGDSSAFTEGMRIRGDGNVGIGTDTPAQKLSVAGTIESTSGGIKFPDGSTQLSAAYSSWAAEAGGTLVG